MKRTVFWLSVSLSAGIVLARSSGLSFGSFFTASFILLALSALSFRRAPQSGLFLLLAVCSLGGALTREAEMVPPSDISRYTNPQEAVTCLLEGIVKNDPVYTPKSATCIMQAKRLSIGEKDYAVSGMALIRFFGERGIAYGDRLIVTGNLRQPSRHSWTRRMNYREFLNRRGIRAIMTVRKGVPVERIGAGEGNPLQACAYRLRNIIKKRIEAYLPPVHAGILNALIVGTRKDIPSSIEEQFIRTGTVHVLSVSGLHVGIVLLIAFIVFRFARMPMRISCIIAIPLLVVYCFLTGAAVPVVRSTVMGIVFCAGYALDRDIDIFNSLAVAALIILIMNPLSFYDIGFQLSFASVLSIVWLSPKISALLSREKSKQPFLRNVTLLFATSFAAWIGTLPLVAYYFGIVTPVALLANMIIVPYSTFIIASGFALIISSFCSLALSCLFSETSRLMIDIFIFIISKLSEFPGAYCIVRNTSIRFVVFSYILIFICIYLLEKHNALKTNTLRNI